MLSGWKKEHRCSFRWKISDEKKLRRDVLFQEFAAKPAGASAADSNLGPTVMSVQLTRGSSTTSGFRCSGATTAGMSSYLDPKHTRPLLPKPMN
jgi:hypothetical protein